MGSKFGSEIQFVIRLVLLQLSNHLLAPAAESSKPVEAPTASLNGVDSAVCPIAECDAAASFSIPFKLFSCR